MRYPSERKHPDERNRFFANVQRTTTCWVWTGLKNEKGYGRFGAYRRGMVLAHRFSWELVNGAIDSGLCVLHRCDTPSCVNPDHLFLGTRADNNADMAAKGRRRVPEGDSHPRRINPSLWPVGADIEGAKLNDRKVRKMRELYEAGGWSFVRLGKRFGVGRTTVENVVKRRKWQHVA